MAKIAIRMGAWRGLLLLPALLLALLGQRRLLAQQTPQPTLQRVSIRPAAFPWRIQKQPAARADTNRTAQDTCFILPLGPWRTPSGELLEGRPVSNNRSRGRLLPSWSELRIRPTTLPRPLPKKLRRAYAEVETQGQLRQARQTARQALAAAGYLEAVLQDSLVGDTLQVGIQPGPHYSYAQAELIGQPAWAVRGQNLDRLVRRRHPFSWRDWNSRIQQILQAYARRGYPRARAVADTFYFSLQSDTAEGPQQFDSAASPQVGVHLRYHIQPGKLHRYGELQLKGDIREKPRFVQALARVRSGDPYDQQALNNLDRVLNNSLYYQNAQPPGLRFLEGGVVNLEVELERKPANRIDALLGLLPPRTDEARFEFTGLVDLRLVSLFRQGEVLELHYEKLTASSQLLDLGFRWPFILGLPLDAGLELHLLKQDTLFLTRDLAPEVGWRFSQLLRVSLHYRNRLSSLLSPAPFAEVAWPPPPILDTQMDLFGLGVSGQWLDYAPNPSRGWQVELRLWAGRKDIRDTPGLDSLRTDLLRSEQPRQELQLDARGYLPLGERGVLALRGQLYWLFQEQVFDNDQRFVGGARSLRGFDENQFLSSGYALATTEFRLLLNRDAYIGLFAEGGYLEYTRVETAEVNWPLGFGVSVALRTPAGQLSLSYALGRDQRTEVQPLAGRVHLGLVSLF